MKVIFATRKYFIKTKAAGKFSSTFFKRWQSSRQRLDLMRKLQLSLLRFKKAKLCFGFLDRVNTSRM